MAGVLAFGDGGIGVKSGRAVMILGLAVVVSACAAPGATGTRPPSPSASALASPAMTQCSPGYPMPSEVVELWFPCGPTAELRPVQRGVTTGGEERIQEVVRLFLDGPDARERQLGFTSLLAPGDAYAEIHDGRLVLDFPAEVTNVSTSAGSRGVIEGLRRSLLPLDGVDEIELRLRNDCAAFFEWIQVGPECHLLTDDGVVPRPTPSTAAVPIIPSEPTGPEITTGSPIAAVDDDGAFRLTLEAGQERYRAGQLIEVEAILAYAGAEDEVVMLGSSHSLVGFGLSGSDPAVEIRPAFTSDCAPHPITPDEPRVFPFTKSGAYTPGDPEAAFAAAYFAQPELRLPVGTWTIGAGTSFYVGPDCGDELHSLNAEVTVTVEP